MESKPTKDQIKGMTVIDPECLRVLHKLGEGGFGVVRVGKYFKGKKVVDSAYIEEPDTDSIFHSDAGLSTDDDHSDHEHCPVGKSKFGAGTFSSHIDCSVSHLDSSDSEVSHSSRTTITRF